MCLNNYETIEVIKMIGFEAKQEGAAASSSRQWAGLRNPRIVRVSRSFGGKDRHSKVCTVRGLRDRRIRLSVTTAIQLYDLQERLHLNQPSKVIDWLLDVTKQDIDKLPPLQMLPGFGQLHQQMLLAHHGQTNNFTYTTTNSSTSHPSLPPFFDANLEAPADDQEDNYNQDHVTRARSKEAEKGKWVKGTTHEQGDFFSGQAAGHRFFPLAAANTAGYATSMLPGNSMNLNTSYNYHHLEPSSTTLSLSQFGTHGFLPPHQGHQNYYLNHLQPAPAPSSIPLPSAPHQFPPSSMPSLFTSQQYFLPNNSLSNVTYTNLPIRPFSLNNQGTDEDRSS